MGSSSGMRGCSTALLGSGLADRSALRASDLVVGQNLQDPDQGRVVPSGAALCDAGVEQLLGGCGVGQRDADLTRARQRKIEVLLVQLDAEARIEGALDHALAMHFENARGGEPAHQGLPDLDWVG